MQETLLTRFDHCQDISNVDQKHISYNYNIVLTGNMQYMVCDYLHDALGTVRFGFNLHTFAHVRRHLQRTI